MMKLNCQRIQISYQTVRFDITSIAKPLKKTDKVLPLNVSTNDLVCFKLRESIASFFRGNSKQKEGRTYTYCLIIEAIR